MCAVTFHALIGDCGETLQGVVGRVNAARFAAFDELCTSEQSVDPMVFLDAIANAECTSTFCAFATPALSLRPRLGLPQARGWSTMAEL